MRHRLLAAATLVAALLCAAPAHGAVKYSDYRWSTTGVFVRYGPQWTQVSTGGYSNPATNFACYPAHGWSYVSRWGSETGVWKLPGGGAFAYGEWQAYITTSGTNTWATYNDGLSNPVVNQLATHGWTTVMANGYCTGSCQLGDSEGSSYVSSHRTDWDAVRFYY
jgi:hypothetical protein